jgi:hypothetical protein
MVGKKCHQHNATKLHGYDHCNDTMGRNWFGLSFGPSIGGIIGNLYLIYSFKVSVQILLGL